MDIHFNKHVSTFSEKIVLQIRCYIIVPLLVISSVAIAQPLASFTSSDTSGCSPHAVHFINTSTNGVNYYWDLGDGNTSTLENPTNLYLNPGSYTVKLVVDDGNNNADSITMPDFIKVKGKPHADFSVSVNTICASTSAIQFNDNSTDAVSWLWDFGDGDTSTLQNPAHLYTLGGLYDVKLVVSNDDGCGDIKVQSNLIHILGAPNIDFGVDTAIVCNQNIPLQFTDLSSPVISWDWDFGDGNHSNLQHPSHIYNNSGQYNVKLKATNVDGCSSQLTKFQFVNILPKFTPVFTTYHTESCLPLHAYFYNQTPNTESLLWDYGDSTTSTSSYPLHVYNTAGVYSVSLTVTNNDNCTFATVVDSAAIAHANPVADFSLTPNSGCAPLAVQFTDNSTAANAWRWEFGDDDSSHIQNPLHQYDEGGDMTVKLTVYDTNSVGSFAPMGCNSSVILPDTVHVISPAAHFDVSTTEGCAPLGVTFSDQTMGAIQWFWDFGDGNTSTQQNPVHVYNVPGVFSVTCIVTNSNSCTDTLVKPSLIVVKGPGFVYQSPQPMNGCVPLSIHLNSSSIGYNNWYWDFGDGNTSTAQNPSHVYHSGGIYVVRLITEAANGCPLVIDTFAVYITHELKAGFELAIDNCPDFKVTFTDTSSGSISNWLWYLGDSTTSSVNNPVHQYGHSGIYSVALTVSDQYGCSNTVSKVNAVTLMPCDQSGNCTGWGIHGPIIIAGEVKGCNPYTVNFVNPLDSTVSWFWDFGDGNTSTMENPSHTYIQNGYHDVMLIVEYYTGDHDTILQPHLVYISDVQAGFSFTGSVSCNNMQVDITDQSVNAVSWLWNFGDGDTSHAVNPSHSYLINNSSYNISQIVRDSNVCADMSVKNFYSGLPTPEFNYPSLVCGNDTVYFTSNMNIFISYLWDFGDGHTSTDINPYHIYDSAGVFNVSLTAYDMSNCAYNYILPTPITVIIPEVSFATYQVTETCFPYTVVLHNLSNNYDSLLWDFGDGDTSTTEGAQHHTYSYGSFDVSLTIFKDGCSSQLIKPEYITIHQVMADFAMSQNRTCLPVTGIFIDLSNNAVSWKWDFGDGDSAFVQNPVHQYNSIPLNDVKLSIVDSNGCQATVTKSNIDVFKFNIGLSDASGCVPFQTSFTETENNAVSWKWDFGDNNNSTLQNPTHTYLNKGFFDISLVAEAPDGCFDTLTLDSIIQVGDVDANFTSLAQPDCAPLLATFIDNSSGADSWYWDFGDNGISNQKNPSHIYNLPGIYTVSLFASDSIGCSDSITITDVIEVLGPVADFDVSDTVGCSPLSVQFVDQSAGAISWSWYFGDGDTSDIQNPSHIYTTEGAYTTSLVVEDSIGCSAVYTYPVNIQILEKPVADFIIEDTAGCAPFQLKLTNNSTGTSNPTFLWIVGSDSSTAENPVFVLNDPGFYNIYLEVTNESGCGDTLEQLNAVEVFSTDMMIQPSIRYVTVLNNHEIELAWEPSVSNDFDYYVVFRKNSNHVFIPIDTIYDKLQNVFIESGLNTLDNSYCYKVGVTNKCSNVILLSELTGHCTMNIEAEKSNDDSGIHIYWNPYAGCIVDKYELYRSYDQFSNESLIAVLNNKTHEFIDTTVYCPLPYSYKVKAIGLCNSNYFSYSDTAMSTIEDFEQELATNIIRTTVLNNQYTLTEWSTSITHPENIRHYLLFRSEDNERFNLIAVLQRETTSYIDNTVDVNLKNYYYRVEIENECGIISGRSNSGSSILLQVDNEGNSKILNWTKYEEWIDGVDYYIIEKKENDQEWMEINRVNGETLKTRDE